MRTQNENPRGFSLIQLVVAIVIIGIMAAIAVPMYVDYIKEARVGEATLIMGAIIKSQMVQFQTSGSFYGANEPDTFKQKGIDISDSKYFTYQTVAYADNWGFTVTADGTPALSSTPGAQMVFTYDVYRTPSGMWSCDGVVIKPEMLPMPSGS